MVTATSGATESRGVLPRRQEMRKPVEPAGRVRSPPEGVTTRSLEVWVNGGGDNEGLSGELEAAIGFVRGVEDWVNTW